MNLDAQLEIDIPNEDLLRNSAAAASACPDAWVSLRKSVSRDNHPKRIINILGMACCGTNMAPF